MNWKRGIWYLVYAIVLIIAISQIQEMNAYYSHQFARTFDVQYRHFAQLLFVFLGGLLGLEHIVGQWKQAGRWKINLWKILFLVLPAAYYAFQVFISVTFEVPIHPFFLHPEMGSVAAVLLGYFILTSFHREVPHRRGLHFGR